MGAVEGYFGSVDVTAGPWRGQRVDRAAIPVYFCTGRDPVLAVYVPLQRLHLGSTATVWIGPGMNITVSKCSIQIT